MSIALEVEYCIGHNSVSQGVCYHPNSEHFLFSSGWSVGIGSLTNQHYQEFLRAHDNVVSCVTLSPSGSLIASGQIGENSDIYVWDFNSRKAIHRFEEHDHGIVKLAFSHDEKILASIGNDDDGKLIFWDMSNGCIIAASSKLPKGTMCLAFGGFVRDIKRRDTNMYQLCTGGSDGLHLWQLNPYNGELNVIKLVGDVRATINRRITTLMFSSDLEELYGSSSSGDFVVANMRSQRITQAVVASKRGLLAISAYKDGLLTGGGDGVVKVFSRDYQAVSEVVLDGPVIGLSLSCDLLEVLASTSAGSIYRINLNTMNSLVLAESHTSGILAVSFSRTIHDKFASISSDGTVRVWDITEYSTTAVGKPRSHQSADVYPICIDFSDVVITGWTDGSIAAHDPDTGHNLWFVESAHAGGVTALRLSHNGRFILTGGMNGEVRLWEVRSREMISHLKEHTKRVTSIEIFHDDVSAVTSSADKSINRWDLKGERRLYSQMQRMGGINSISLSVDQTQIVSVGQERKLSYWDLSSPSPVHEAFLHGEEEEGMCVKRSHDGELIATGGSGGVVRIWHFRSGREVACVTSHSGCVTSLSFSHDDRQLLSCGSDGCIVVWCLFRQ